MRKQTALYIYSTEFIEFMSPNVFKFLPLHCTKGILEGFEYKPALGLCSLSSMELSS